MSANGARRILDIGIGNGAHAEAILSDQTRRLTGIDIVTPPVWPDLRDRFGDRIELHEADFLGWAPSSDAFDFVMDLGCYHHQAPEAHAPYLEKIRALTTRRGRFLLCVYGAEPEAASAVSEEKTDHGRLSYRFTPDALEARLADAGFESIELKRVERPSLREHYLVAVSGPARSRS
ncbi:MAG: class I SAM-dependent methyltransferase [Planctomycetota bacterium]